jgi:hypothetical protein
MNDIKKADASGASPFLPPVHRSRNIHCKKRSPIFPASAGMSLSKLSLAGNNLIIAGQEEFS